MHNGASWLRSNYKVVCFTVPRLEQFENVQNCHFLCFFFSNGMEHNKMKITVLTPLLMYVSLSLISMKLENFQGTSVGTQKWGFYWPWWRTIKMGLPIWGFGKCRRFYLLDLVIFHIIVAALFISRQMIKQPEHTVKFAGDETSGRHMIINWTLVEA